MIVSFLLIIKKRGRVLRRLLPFPETPNRNARPSAFGLRLLSPPDILFPYPAINELVYLFVRMCFRRRFMGDDLHARRREADDVILASVPR